jgi:hypothetical protein
MPLKGNLNDFGLEEVIQTIFTGRKSGKLEISGKMGIYGIFFENGKIIHAFGPFTIGGEAIKDAFLEDEGNFIFKQNLILPPQTIKKESIGILMDGISIRNELIEIAKMLKKELKIQTANGFSENIEISGDEWEILKLLMEGKTVGEIIEKQNLTFTEFSKIVKKLYEKKLITL